MATWDDLLSEHDKEVTKKAGRGGRIGLGKKPALLLIDVTYPMVGDRPEPVLESIKRFPQSCGEAGWKAIEHMIPLLSLAREKNIPIIYVDRKLEQPSLMPKRRNLKFTPPDFRQQGDNNIVREIAPVGNDVIIFKRSASVFFGTPIMSILVPLGIDTLLVCGFATGGCVQASVTDAASYGFRVAVIEECTSDRIEIVHKVSLFQMDCAKADVVSVAEVKEYLSKL